MANIAIAYTYYHYYVYSYTRYSFNNKNALYESTSVTIFITWQFTKLKLINDIFPLRTP